LLKQAPRHPDESTLATLDVWDMQLATLGEKLLELRYEVLSGLMPLVRESYETLAGVPTAVVATYRPSWGDQPLADALVEGRQDDLRRRVSTLGPHRDDVVLELDGFASRTEASQGEQRTLALALRLAGHRLVSASIGEPPLLLLDDVLSELDHDRATALLASLPPGQTVITSASGLPAATVPDQVLRHCGGSSHFAVD
jgi:DNA replication and repair protein RecF